jgi:hypothetical protein
VPTWLSLTADIASLVSVLVTFAVWFQTRSIKKSFALKARLPEISTTLTEISTSLLRGLQDGIGNATHADIARLNALLVNLRPKLSRSERELVTKLLDRCGTRPHRWTIWTGAKRSHLSRDEEWEIYNETQGLIEVLRQVTKDSNWS